MKKAFVILIHAGYWLLYLLLLAVIFTIAGTQAGKTGIFLNFRAIFPIITLCVIPNLISFYSFYFLLFPRFLRQRKIFLLVIFGALFCLLAGLSGSLISLIFFGTRQAIWHEPQEFFWLTASLFSIAAIHGGIALVIRGFISWYAEIKLKEELMQKNFAMELALIKSQINPHFLFNTLNNIDVLITKDAARASSYLNKLSDILRYLVYETKTEKILLAAELGYIEKYLELQKIRTTNPNYVNFEVKGSAGNLMIAPIILFPFIENAFKHTENKKSVNSIVIKVTIENRKLVFECENSYYKNLAIRPDYGGVGNELIQKRLMLLYPGSHSLEITDDGKIYRVKLALDLYEN